MHRIIHPILYEPNPDYIAELYLLKFPDSWREALREIIWEGTHNINIIQPEKNLPSKELNKLIASKFEKAIKIGSIKCGGENSEWLTLAEIPTDEDLKRICQLVLIWLEVNPKFVGKTKDNAINGVKAKLDNLIHSIESISEDAPELRKIFNVRTKKTRFADAEGKVCSDSAFDPLAFLAAKEIVNNGLKIYGQLVHFYFAGSYKELISSPITAANGDRYSYNLGFSGQTIPPERKIVLNLQLSITRWIKGVKPKRKTVYMANDIHALVKATDISYGDFTIRKRENGIFIDKYSSVFYYKYLGGNNKLFRKDKDITAELRHIDDYPEILVPYKEGMNSFMEPEIGKGISFPDASLFFILVGEKLKAGNIIKDSRPLEIPAASNKNIKVDCKKNYRNSHQEFREHVRKCIRATSLTFELYGPADNDPIIAECIRQLERDFGGEEDNADSALTVKVTKLSIGDLTDELDFPKRANRKERYARKANEFCRKLSAYRQISNDDVRNEATACICIIPDAENYRPWSDPKKALRNGFALSNRLVQFITPPDEDSGKKDSQLIERKVEAALTDLYRQLGITLPVLADKRQPELTEIPCIGLYFIPIEIKDDLDWNERNKLALPVLVEVNISEGGTTVYSHIFPEGLPYRLAQLELAKFYHNVNAKKICKEILSKTYMKEMLETLKVKYQDKDVLLIVHKDSYAQKYWPMVSDKNIAENYADREEKDSYPDKISTIAHDINLEVRLKGTGIRIIRLREGDEVPDYFTEEDEQGKFSERSGIYQFGKIFWCIATKPSNDRRYFDTKIYKRMDAEDKDFLKMRMVEFYPMHLQPGDNDIEWINLANTYRRMHIQYDGGRYTILPLPLHLAKKMNEYSFIPEKY